MSGFSITDETCRLLKLNMEKTQNCPSLCKLQYIPWKSIGTKVCPLVGSGILVPWIIPKTSHFVWSSKDFPGSIIQQTPTLNALGCYFSLYFPRVYNNTSNTSNIFLGRCYTHGCVAITIFIGLIGNPFRESAVFVFSRWSSRGLKSTSSLHACLQWPRRQW